mgnify:CR=1 FL=1
MNEAPIINRTSPEQFGRVNVLGITPSAENGLYPARVELRDVSRIADFFDVSVDSLLGREPLEVK